MPEIVNASIGGLNIPVEKEEEKNMDQLLADWYDRVNPDPEEFRGCELPSFPAFPVVSFPCNNYPS